MLENVKIKPNKLTAVCCSFLCNVGRKCEYIRVARLVHHGWLHRRWTNTDSGLWKRQHRLANIRIARRRKKTREGVKGKWNNTWHSISEGFAQWAFTSASRSAWLDMCPRRCWVFRWPPKSGQRPGSCLKGAVRHRARFGETLERWKLTLETTFHISFHP